MALFHRLGKPWLWSYTRIFKPSTEGFRILTFHDVPRRECRAFEKLLDFILQHNQILSPADVEKIAKDNGTRQKSPAASFVITFDDGYASNVEVSRSVLRDRGIRAVFFVCPQLLDLP